MFVWLLSLVNQVLLYAVWTVEPSTVNEWIRDTVHASWQKGKVLIKFLYYWFIDLYVHFLRPYIHSYRIMLFKTVTSTFSPGSIFESLLIITWEKWEKQIITLEIILKFAILLCLWCCRSKYWGLDNYFLFDLSFHPQLL